MDALQLAARHLEIAGPAGAAGQDHRVVFRLHPIDRQVYADVDLRAERHAFLLHQRQPAIQDLLLHLELGDAVAQQPADAIGLFEDGDEMPRAVQLLGRRQSGRAGADDRDLPAGAHERRLGGYPALLEGFLDDRHFDRLDRDGVVVDAEHARPFARRRAEAPGELGKIVRRVQPVDGRLPPIAVHEIVPVGNQVAQRAALMAERNAAVHAARALLLELSLRVRKIDLSPVLEPLGHRTGRLFLPVNFDEPGRFTHNSKRQTKKQEIRRPGGFF